MDSILEYALMAASAYQEARRSTLNQLLPPTTSGWGEIPGYYTRDRETGFEAKAFQRVSGGVAEIVIAFTGTDERRDWTESNFPLALGFSTRSIGQAALLYAKIVSENPTAKVTFTGHSLGGGLAALMGVFFAETAITFDQAPFRSSANATVSSELLGVIDGFIASNPGLPPQGLSAVQAIRAKLVGFSAQALRKV
jgi:hypothetical protein